MPLNQGGKNLAFPTCIASAEFSTMIQEPLVMTGTSYPGPSNVTADDKEGSQPASLQHLQELNRS